MRKNSEKRREYSRQYYQEHKEQYAKASKKWFAKHKEERRAYDRKWRRLHPDLTLAYSRKRDNKDQSKYLNDWGRRNRIRVLEHYGNKCVCCGETTYEFLTLDHKNNDGAIERKKDKFCTRAYYVIKKGFPDNLQILCYNCNMSKGHHGICPHQRLVKNNPG